VELAGPSVVFTYDSPHLKSSLVLESLVESGAIPSLVIAAPLEKLSVYQLERQDFVRSGLTFKKDQRAIADELGIPYLVAKHNSEEAFSTLRELQPELGIVAGARILSETLIRKFSKGVLNAHPGLIPENRGLYNFHYGILRQLPQAVTLHFIDERVDAGRIIEKEILQISPKHSAAEVNREMMKIQIRMLSQQFTYSGLGAVEARVEGNPPNPRLTKNLENMAVNQFDYYRTNYAAILERYLGKNDLLR